MEKSKLELYLATVLPFGGRHPDALENLVSMVPKRLGRNAKLRRQLAEDGNKDGIPIDAEQIETLFALVARGLAWFHWQIYLDESQSSRAVVLSAFGVEKFKEIVFRRVGRSCTSKNLANSTFGYEGKQALDDPTTTIWRFSVYGGLFFLSSGEVVPPAASSEIFAMTGPVGLVEGLSQI
jgi:hypothetical protein